MKISISKLNKARNGFKVVVSLGFQIFVFLILFYSTLNAGSLSGTSGLSYAAYHNVFRSGQQAQGMVRMANGFTILTPSSGTGSNHGSIAYLETSLSVSGGIDLRTTNTMFLKTDLNLESNTTFSPYGGTIRGYDRSLILNGDLYIPDNSTFHIGGRIIIDGNWNTLNIGNSSKFLIDANATLTLRNLIIKNIQNQPGNPCLQCSTFGSKLCLDNVILSLTDDFYFNCGQLFIHNDVAFTGTSSLIYTSPIPMVIDSDSIFHFDFGTTFSIAPSTFTDCPYTVVPTYTTNNFVFMKDQTSQIYLNGCSLCTTLTGCRFTKGSMIFDNKTSLNSNYTLSIAGIPGTQVGSTVTTGNSPRLLSWSPDGKTIASVEESSNNLKLYSFNGVSTPSLIATIATGTTPTSVSWSPDGRFIVVSAYGSTSLELYKFTKPNTLTFVGSAYFGSIYHVEWSPDGRFIAGTNNTAFGVIRTYRFLGEKAPIQVGGSGLSNHPGNSVSWSKDGKFIVVGITTDSLLQIYSFRGQDDFDVNSVAQVGSSLAITTPVSPQWSPDSRFIAVGSSTASTSALKIFSFDGVHTLRIVSTVSMPSKTIHAVSWSPNGKFLAVGTASFACIQIYAFDGRNLTLMGTIPTSQARSYGVAWSPDGKFVAVTTYQSPGALQVFRINYIVDRSPQALSNSIVFGNSALGETYDVNLIGLSEAQVEIDGLMNYDCAT